MDLSGKTGWDPAGGNHYSDGSTEAGRNWDKRRAAAERELDRDLSRTGLGMGVKGEALIKELMIFGAVWVVLKLGSDYVHPWQWLQSSVWFVYKVVFGLAMLRYFWKGVLLAAVVYCAFLVYVRMVPEEKPVAVVPPRQAIVEKPRQRKRPVKATPAPTVPVEAAEATPPE